MGYYMYQMESDFTILKENHVRALGAIKALAGQETIEDSSGAHFSWVETQRFVQASTLEDALKEWRWDAELNDEGDLIDMYFEGQKYGDDEVLFNAIAPFVESGSYIQMRGEDDAIWRWVFEGGKVREVGASITF